MDLHGKVILITGAKGGLGTFVTNSFLESRARVFGVSRSIADSDFPHPNFSAVPAELSDGDRARQVIENVVGKAGRIDGLVHLVGRSPAGAPSLRRTMRRSTRCWISICDRRFT
jgi:NAD(P)-dependent dehydrogenase (short-subunit alcohol dehydrogenase family)